MQNITGNCIEKQPPQATNSEGLAATTALANKDRINELCGSIIL